MNAEDREIVTEIKIAVNKIADVVDRDEQINRALSVSLIGRANGTVVDEGGGRIGRLERLVTWAISGVVGIMIWLIAQFITRIIK